MPRQDRDALVDVTLDNIAVPILGFTESALALVPLPGIALIATGLKILFERVQVSAVAVLNV